MPGLIPVLNHVTGGLAGMGGWALASIAPELTG